MKTSWSKFRKDRFYLLKYFSIQIIVFSFILALQLHLTTIRHPFKVEMTIWSLILLPLGLIIGVKAPALMHNCVHRNLRPPILNFIAGEIVGVYILLGLAPFELNHTMHHAHADTDLDPHNPHLKSFIPFFFANNFGGTGPVLAKYLQFHGATKINRMLFGLTVFLHFIGVPMRLVFWYLLLGPTFFVTFFIPSYVFHMFVFAHINFITHETQADGKVRILNLDSNLYYRLVNYFGDGVYYHKNHHISPGHYNPQKGSNQSSFLFK